ncbi:MAG: replicative DNA helicase [Deltaproteobacteria bacterium]|nr:replicative DNA helicase [Deltaproteobacteria bacterium]
MNGSKSAPPGGNDASLRVPPHNLHAEQAVLASVLLNNDLMSDVVEVLRPDDFYQGAHRTLYEAMLGLYEGGRPIDHLTLSAVIRDRGAEQQIGGLAYLAEIVSTVPLSANAAEYAVIVKEKSILRKSIVAAQEISTSAFQGVGDLREFLDRMEERIFAISGEEIKPKYFSMNEMARAALKDIEKAYEQKKRITGIPSGFRDLDEVTAGFQKSNMIVVAARPAMGKTSLCLNIAVSAAIRHKVPVAIFSLEMSRQELAMRMICSEARVNFQRLRTGQIGQEEINRLVAAVAKLSDAPIYTDDSGALSALDLRARARRLKKDKDVGLIIIDYLQLMRGSAARSNPDNRVQEVSEISRSMKALAKELDIPVIAISQLSRGVENRSDKRPQMADLRECVTGDTLVLTTDGGRVPIRELVGKSVDVWAMSPEGRIVPAKSDCVWSVGVKPVMRVTLASGRTIRATAEHLLYGAGAWTRVGVLRSGDALAVAREEVFSSCPERTTAGGTGTDRRNVRSTSTPSGKVPGGYASILEDDALRQWAESDLFWDRVMEVSPDGSEEVFDLTVPGPASWFADGVVSHNSGAIEQDSDLILFVYREEMYSKEKTPQEEKGVAEIIVGKNRSGPMRDVKLAFLAQFTRFEDLAQDYE